MLSYITKKKKGPTPSHGAFPFSAFPCRKSRNKEDGLLTISKIDSRHRMCVGFFLPGSRVTEPPDELSTVHLQLQFSHEPAI